MSIALGGHPGRLATAPGICRTRPRVAAWNDTLAAWATPVIRARARSGTAGRTVQAAEARGGDRRPPARPTVPTVPTHRRAAAIPAALARAAGRGTPSPSPGLQPMASRMGAISHPAMTGHRVVPGNGREARCGGRVHSVPLARAAGGRSGASRPHRARRTRCTRRDSSRRGTPPPCAPLPSVAVLRRADQRTARIPTTPCWRLATPPPTRPPPRRGPSSTTPTSPKDGWQDPTRRTSIRCRKKLRVAPAGQARAGQARARAPP
jgi:hypothetical protein